MNGRDSYGVPAGLRESLGSSRNRLTSVGIEGLWEQGSKALRCF